MEEEKQTVQVRPQPTAQKPVIVLAGSYAEYRNWLRENHLTPTQAVRMDESARNCLGLDAGGVVTLPGFCKLPIHIMGRMTDYARLCVR